MRFQRSRSPAIPRSFPINRRSFKGRVGQCQVQSRHRCTARLRSSPINRQSFKDRVGRGRVQSRHRSTARLRSSPINRRSFKGRVGPRPDFLKEVVYNPRVMPGVPKVFLVNYGGRSLWLKRNLKALCWILFKYYQQMLVAQLKRLKT